MRFVAVILVADIAVLQHKQEFSLGYMQVRSRRVRADDLFHALTTYQKSAPRLVVMPIIKQRADGFRTDVFSALVQMGIDICRGGQVGVTDEGRYIQQRHILIDEDAGEGVAQIVKPYLAQTVLPDKVGKPLCNPIRAYQPAKLIDADIIVVFAVVAALEHTAVQVLLFPFLAQHFIHWVRQRPCQRRGNGSHLADALDHPLHFLVVLHLEGVTLERVQLGQRNVPHPLQLGIVPIRLRGEQIVQRG